MAFQLPVFYNQQLPDITSGMITVQKHRNINLTMLSHRSYRAFDNPEPNLLDSMLIVYELLSKIKETLYDNKKSPVKGLK